MASRSSAARNTRSTRGRRQRQRRHAQRNSNSSGRNSKHIQGGTPPTGHATSSGPQARPVRRTLIRTQTQTYSRTTRAPRRGIAHRDDSRTEGETRGRSAHSAMMNVRRGQISWARTSTQTQRLRKITGGPRNEVDMTKQLFRWSSASTHLPTPANEHWNPPRGVRCRETETQETQQTK